jgi:hypothetical protein
MYADNHTNFIMLTRTNKVYWALERRQTCRFPSLFQAFCKALSLSSESFRDVQTSEFLPIHDASWRTSILQPKKLQLALILLVREKLRR